MLSYKIKATAFEEVIYALTYQTTAMKVELSRNVL